MFKFSKRIFAVWHPLAKCIVLEILMYCASISNSLNVTVIRPSANNTHTSDVFSNPSCDKMKTCTKKNASCEGKFCCKCVCYDGMSYLTQSDNCLSQNVLRTGKLPLLIVIMFKINANPLKRILST